MLGANVCNWPWPRQENPLGTTGIDSRSWQWLQHLFQVRLLLCLGPLLHCFGMRMPILPPMILWGVFDLWAVELWWWRLTGFNAVVPTRVTIWTLFFTIVNDRVPQPIPNVANQLWVNFTTGIWNLPLHGISLKLQGFRVAKGSLLRISFLAPQPTPGSNPVVSEVSELSLMESWLNESSIVNWSQPISRKSAVVLKVLQTNSDVVNNVDLLWSNYSAR